MSAPLPIPEQADDNSYSFTAAMSCDGDGANGHDGSGRACYGPHGTNPLDFLANAGHPGDWWGVVTNEHGEPVRQTDNDPAPGYYISNTSYERKEFGKFNPDRYVDSATEFFIVVPKHWRRDIPGVVLGCKALVTDTRTGTAVDAVVADFGPSGHLGEASMAVCRALGLGDSPKNGGSESPHYRYQFWPDVAADGYQLQPA